MRRELGLGWPRPELGSLGLVSWSRVPLAINIVPRTGAPPCGPRRAMPAELILKGDVTKSSSKICVEFRGDSCFVDVGFLSQIYGIQSEEWD